jgi:hypothetical protein
MVAALTTLEAWRPVLMTVPLKLAAPGRRLLFIPTALLAGTMLLSACSSSATPSTGSTASSSTSASSSSGGAATGAPVVRTSPVASSASPIGASASASPVAAGSKVNPNTASIPDIQAALEANGVPNAARWAREVDEYKPYPADDPNMAKLRQNLAKYNPAPDVVDKIVASLAPA